MRISTHIDVYELSEDDYWLFIANLDDICFCQLPAAIFVPGERDTNVASPYKAL